MQVPATRKFDIRTYKQPQLNIFIKFKREGYSAGSIAEAEVRVTRPNGKDITSLPSTKISGSATIDGTFITAPMSDKNKVKMMKLEVPKELTSGEGTLSVTVVDGGIV